MADQTVPSTARPRLTLAERIADARFAAHMTLAQVGAIAGISGPSLSKWETGTRSPRLGNLLAVAAAVGADPAYLLGLTDVVTPSDAQEIAHLGCQLVAKDRRIAELLDTLAERELAVSQLQDQLDSGDHTTCAAEVAELHQQLAAWSAQFGGLRTAKAGRTPRLIEARMTR